MKTRTLLSFLASMAFIGLLAGCESAPPSEDEIKAGLTSELKDTVEQTKEMNARLIAQGQEPMCVIHSSMEVTSSGAEPAQVAGDKAIVKVHPTYTFTKDFADIAKEQKCGSVRNAQGAEASHGKIQKGAQIHSPYRDMRTTRTLTFGKFKDGWKLTGEV